jgi:hypothetical protein
MALTKPIRLNTVTLSERNVLQINKERADYQNFTSNWNAVNNELPFKPAIGEQLYEIRHDVGVNQSVNVINIEGIGHFIKSIKVVFRETLDDNITAKTTHGLCGHICCKLNGVIIAEGDMAMFALMYIIKNEYDEGAINSTSFKNRVTMIEIPIGTSWKNGEPQWANKLRGERAMIQMQLKLTPINDTKQRIMFVYVNHMMIDLNIDLSKLMVKVSPLPVNDVKSVNSDYFPLFILPVVPLPKSEVHNFAVGLIKHKTTKQLIIPLNALLIHGFELGIFEENAANLSTSTWLPSDSGLYINTLKVSLDNFVVLDILDDAQDLLSTFERNYYKGYKVLSIKFDNIKEALMNDSCLISGEIFNQLSITVSLNNEKTQPINKKIIVSVLLRTTSRPI